MTAITNTILGNAYQGSLNGALFGAKVGTAAVTALVGVGIFHAMLEKETRVMGNEPKWAIFEGDCQLPQFRNLNECTHPVLVSFPVFTFFVVAGATASGAVIGAVSGAAKGVWGGKPSHHTQ